MLGIFSKTIDSNFIEAAGFAGLDFIILDQEHGTATLELLNNHVRAAKIAGIKSIIRVPANQPHLIGGALDIGADGVQVPNVSSYAEALEAVKAAKFYPKGMRGVCRFVRDAEYGTIDRNTYFSESNKKLLILQVKKLPGVSALDEILTIQDFDVLFVGPYDLSQSVGHPGDIRHPDVTDMIRNIAAKVAKTNKILGTFADDIETARLMKSLGFSLIAYSVDLNIFVESCKNLIKTLS